MADQQRGARGLDPAAADVAEDHDVVIGRGGEDVVEVAAYLQAGAAGQIAGAEVEARNLGQLRGQQAGLQLPRGPGARGEQPADVDRGAGPVRELLRQPDRLGVEFPAELGAEGQRSDGAAADRDRHDGRGVDGQAAQFVALLFRGGSGRQELALLR